MTGRRYFRATVPAPWNRRGVGTVTVRTADTYEVYLCVGRRRVRLNEDEAWALLAVLEVAMPAAYGPAPIWTHEPIAEASA